MFDQRLLVSRTARKNGPTQRHVVQGSGNQIAHWQLAVARAWRAASFTPASIPTGPICDRLGVAFLAISDFELFEWQMLFDDLPDVVVEIVGRSNGE